jgi:hypothetical protein
MDNGDTVVLLGPGDTVLFPHGVRHAFANQSAATTRALVVTSPGGLETLRETTRGVAPDVAAARPGATGASAFPVEQGLRRCHSQGCCLVFGEGNLRSRS